MKSTFETHEWITREPREIRIDGKLMHQRHCHNCGREFARFAEGADREWRAVNPLPTRFEFLHEEISARWLGQRCPGILLVSDEDDRRHVMRSRS